MSSHHDNHHTEEKKPVSFRTPMILGLVTLLAIVLLVSTCDKKHGGCECKEECSEECMKKCEAGAEHGGHDAHATEAATEQHTSPITDVTTVISDDEALEFLDSDDELGTDSIAH